jgi:hypothetical protein
MGSENSGLDSFVMLYLCVLSLAVRLFVPRRLLVSTGYHVDPSPVAAIASHRHYQVGSARSYPEP